MQFKFHILWSKFEECHQQIYQYIGLNVHGCVCCFLDSYWFVLAKNSSCDVGSDGLWVVWEESWLEGWRWRAQDLFGPKVLWFNMTSLSSCIHSCFILFSGYGHVFQYDLSALPKTTIALRSLKFVAQPRLPISVTPLVHNKLLFRSLVLPSHTLLSITGFTCSVLQKRSYRPQFLWL